MSKLIAIAFIASFIVGSQAVSCTFGCKDCDQASGKCYFCSPDVYANINFNCIDCDPNCNTCTFANEKVCTTCAAGFVVIGGTCQPEQTCPTYCNCDDPTDPSRCTSCRSPYDFKGAECCSKSCASCDPTNPNYCTSCPSTSQILFNGACGPCRVSNCVTCTKNNPWKCDKCKANWKPFQFGSSCVKI
jgi:hypothetical protein